MARIYTQPCGREQAAATRGAAAHPDRDGVWVLAATILGSSMAFIDGTVVNVALPLIQQDLGATAADLQWIVESYALLLAALILVGGSAGDRFGRRRIFQTGVAVFAAASLACAVAPDTLSLIVFRAIQGIGGALLVPGSLALIGASFSKKERGKAIGTWSAASALTMAIGPVLGGWLAETYSWRWIFFINLPLAAIVMALTAWKVPESRDPDTVKLDWPGAMTATLGLGGLAFALTEAARLGLTHPWVLSAFVLGIVSLWTFTVRQMRTAHPMVPPFLFANPSFTGANLMTFLIYMGLGGVLFLMPLALMNVYGFSATGAAAAFLPFVAVMGLFSRAAGRLVDRTDPRAPLTAGPLMTAGGFVLLAMANGQSDYWTGFFPGILAMAIGMVLTVAPVTTTVMTAAPDSRAGAASGINNAVARAAALFAIAVFGLIATVLANARLGTALAAAMGPEAAQSLPELAVVFGQIEAAGPLPASATDTVREAAAQAFLSAYRDTLLVMAVMPLLASAIAWRMVGGKAA